MNSTVSALIFVLMLAGFPAAILAEPIRIVIEVEPDVENGERLYEICASCHLPEGWGNRDGTYPGLAGQQRNVLMKQLIDIREGKRDNPIMFPFVQDRTIGGVKNLADIVAYIATLPVNPENGKGPWEAGTDDYRQGENLYKSQCVACHGERAEGSNQQTYPRLQGQHYMYLLRQAYAVKFGRRKNADAAMQEIAGRLSEKELQQVVNYIARLPDPQQASTSGSPPPAEQ